MEQIEAKQAASENVAKAKSRSTCVKLAADEYAAIASDAKTTGKSIPVLLRLAYFSGRRARVLVTKDEQSVWFKELRHCREKFAQLVEQIEMGGLKGWFDEFELARQSLQRIENAIVGTHGHR